MHTHIHYSHSEPSTSVHFLGSPYQYYVKVINRLKKSEYSIRRLRGYCSKFQSVDELKDKLRETLPDSASGDVVGYIEPGHGAKGKQRWVEHSDDLADIYSSYGKKLEILCGVMTKQSLIRIGLHPGNALYHQRILALAELLSVSPVLGRSKRLRRA